MMCVFSSTFMDGNQGWVIILTCIGTVIASFIIWLSAVYFMRFGGALIGGMAGFMFGILMNNAWFYLWGSVIVTYSVCGVLATVCFVFGLFEHKMNTTVIFGNSWIGAYMLVRGVSVYVGYW